MRWVAAILGLATIFAGGTGAWAQDPTTAMDYAKAENWLCHPDRPGACDADLSTTRFGPQPVDGAPREPGWEPPIDCFYVYPTVSRQPGGNSDGRMTEEERFVAAVQFAAFGRVCRRFAPLYRQTTLANIAGTAKGDVVLAYEDVRAAFRQYLKEHNDAPEKGEPEKGRGILLIGHSQGARHLARLIADEVIGRPVQARIVAAYAIGFPIPVAETAGASAPPMLKPCRDARDTGCLVGYASFAAAKPPAADNRLAGRPRPGLRLACVNPAALLGKKTLTGIFPARSGEGRGGIGPGVSLAPAPVKDAFYQLSGQLEATCVRTAETDYLAISSPVPAVEEALRKIDAALPGWGLHLVDVNLAQRTLLQLAEQQSTSWLHKRGDPK